MKIIQKFIHTLVQEVGWALHSLIPKLSFFFFGCTAQHVEHSLPGIECTWRLNHWSSREVPKSVFLISSLMTSPHESNTSATQTAWFKKKLLKYSWLTMCVNFYCIAKWLSYTYVCIIFDILFYYGLCLILVNIPWSIQIPCFFILVFLLSNVASFFCLLLNFYLSWLLYDFWLSILFSTKSHTAEVSAIISL